jgi:steroid 5-alpha reductase family enzyme
MLGASFSLTMLVMIGCWFIYRFQRNGGVVDIGWGLSFLLTSWAYMFLGHGDFLKKLILTAMVTVWAGRLVYHLYHRYANAKSEEPRYKDLRDKWGGDPNQILFLMLFVFQGFLVVILSLPFFIVALNATNTWSWWEFSGIVVWAIGVYGETVADRQLTRFLSNPENQKKVCNIGLWRFSRHPNYFFEIIVWIGFYLFALQTPGGSLAIISPILMAYLIIYVSGIPMAEAQSLKSKGELYHDYQEKTSVIIPWFPKNTSNDS